MLADYKMCSEYHVHTSMIDYHNTVRTGDLRDFVGNPRTRQKHLLLLLDKQWSPEDSLDTNPGSTNS